MTSSDDFSPLPPLTHPEGEPRVPSCISDCKYDKCPAFWFEGVSAGCSHVPQDIQLLRCENCGEWYAEYGSGCPDCNEEIVEPLCNVVSGNPPPVCEPHNCGISQLECAFSMDPPSPERL